MHSNKRLYGIIMTLCMALMLFPARAKAAGDYLLQDDLINGIDLPDDMVSEWAAEELTITKQPVSVEVAKAGATATLTVEATGTDLSYTWYYKDAGAMSFTESSIKTASVSVKVTAARDGRQLYCVVKDGGGKSVTSDTATVSIKKETTLAITKQPVSVEVAKAGDSATISVEATGSNLSYTWYYKDAGATDYTLSNVKTASVTLKVNAAKDGRQLYCVVKDGSGKSVTSNVVTISIKKSSELAITKQPVSVEVAKAGETATISVEATGNSLSYAWYYKDAGATNYTLSNIKTASVTLKVNAAKDGRQLYCVVKDGSGKSVTSNVVTISIRKSSELAITKQPVSVEVAKSGDAATISIEATGDGLSYAWYYKDAGATDYALSNIKTATVTLKVNAAKDGRQLYCVVKDGSGKSVTSNVVTLSIKKSTTSLAITKQPVSVEVAKAGDSATLTVEATGDGLSYTWYYKDAGATGFTASNIKTATVTVKVTAARNGRQLYCVVKDGNGKTVTSNTVTVSIK